MHRIDWELCVMEGYPDFETMLRDLKQQYVSDDAIADKIGVSHASLKNKRKELGIAAVRRPRN